MMDRLYSGKASWMLVWTYVWTECAEEETQDKQYPNSNRRKWYQANRKLLGFPFDIWIIGVNDSECWEGSHSPLVGIFTHLSVVLSNITMQYFVIFVTCWRFHKWGSVIFSPTVHILCFCSFVCFCIVPRIILILNHKTQTFHRTQIRCMKKSE